MATEAQPVQQERLSRVGKRPLAIPKGVTVNFTAEKIDVQGPKGKLSGALPPSIKISKDGDALKIVSDAEGRNAPRLQGLARALIANMLKGASVGYEQVLELVGTGYRAEVKGGAIHLALGLSHPVVFKLTPGLTATVPPDSKGAILILSCADKGVLGQAAATIRSFRPPEPYAGKGVRYRGENVRRKAGKAGKK
jgi:large subunit ribosomal protein L6